MHGEIKETKRELFSKTWTQLTYLLTLFFLVICHFKCITKKSKGTGDNLGGRSTGGGGNQGVIITAEGVCGMSAGCAGNGRDGCGGCGANGGASVGGDAIQGVIIYC